MKPIRVRFINGATGGEEFLSGFPTPTPGLVAHRSAQSCPDGPCFMVTHARTGCLPSGYCFASPEGALLYAKNLARFADWQQDGEAVRAAIDDETRDTVRKIARHFGGLLHQARTPTEGRFIDNGVIA